MLISYVHIGVESQKSAPPCSFHYARVKPTHQPHLNNSNNETALLNSMESNYREVDKYMGSTEDKKFISIK